MKKLLLVIPLGAFIFAGCANTNKDIAILNKKIWQIKKDVRKLGQEHKEIKSDLQELSSRVDNISQIASQNSVEIEKLKMKINSLSSRRSYTPPTSPAIPTGTTTTQPSDDMVSLDDRELYKRALKAYYEQNFDKAKSLFLELVNKYPYSKFYDNALFWVGQIYYKEGKYDRALEYFDRIINECDAGTAPDCNKMSYALLKKADTLIALGEKEKAREILRRIVREFSDSEAYDVAKKKLETLNY